MKEIIKILGNYKLVKKEFFLSIFVMILAESVLLYSAELTKRLVSIVEQKQEVHMLYLWLFITFVYTIIYLGIRLLSNYLGIKLWLILYKKKQLEFQEKIIDKNYKDIIDIGTGKLLTRLESGVFAFCEIFFAIKEILVGVIFKLLLITTILVLYIPKLIFIVIGAIFILGIANFYLRKYINKNSVKEQECLEEFGKNKTKIIMDNFTVKLFNKKQEELEKSEKVIQKASEYGLKSDTANEGYYKVLEFIIRIIEIGVYFLIGTLIIDEGAHPISYLVAVIWYIWFLWDPIDKAVNSLNRINRQWEKYSKLQKFIEIPNEIVNGEKEYEYKTGNIELRNISFSYKKDESVEMFAKNISEENMEKVSSTESKEIFLPNISTENSTKYIFKNLDLQFLPGKKNALIGHSGGGKSTITKLILRLYDVKSGEILIDGQNIKDLEIGSFYKKIGYLPQEPAVFDGTIRENMEYALNQNPLEDLIWEALKKARIDDMVKNLEQGLDTEIGEKGIKLSGGEKQRLAIARIFLKNPEIIILDEPTSALDSISEAKITESLNELTKGKTSIIIAHRLQTVMNADKIIVIENGNIEAEGNHKNLLEKSKVYKTLVDLQNGKIIE